MARENRIYFSSFSDFEEVSGSRFRLAMKPSEVRLEASLGYRSTLEPESAGLKNYSL
jgi:hypothetical protein